MSAPVRVLLVGCALVACACGAGQRQERTAEEGAGWVPLSAPDLGPVVARVGKTPIHAAEVSAQASRRGRPPREALDELVRFHLMAERARVRGGAALPPADPERLVQRLLERDFEGSIDAAQISEADLRAAYQANLPHFVRPRRVQVGMLSAVIEARSTPEQRARVAETARRLEARLAAKPPASLEEFAGITREPPFEAARLRYSYFWQGPTAQDGPFGGKIAAAAMRLSRPGQRSPLLEDPATGYHVLWHVQEEPARNIDFAAAREEVRRRMHEGWRQQRFTELGARLAASHRVEVFPDRVLRPASRP